ncbi:polysaccharide pyruvyl transferase family protein [Vibrio parahaemolyticus]|nr:polysaccharide pyruvyl transferase family protein [Vibrio parahaemolyticus]MBE5131202.1 polysaccharide pyruvyl transferase family protein [Vibrio parahaemolyticus]
MIQWISEGNGIYLQQSVAPFIRYARQNNSSQTESVPEHHEESLRASIAPDMSTTQFRAFVATKMRLYYSVDQWMEDSARFDFSIGLRLHGNMAAWQSGTPAIWIYHDSRTRELAETMCLPHISHTDFLAKNSLTELRDSIDFSFEKYSSQRNLLKERYRNILNDAGIKSELN